MATPAKKPALRKKAPPKERPSTGRRWVDLDDVVDNRQAGGKTVPVTLLDKCLETLRFGGTVADAASRLSITKETFHEWVRKGESLAADLLSGRRTAASLDKNEARAVRFANETGQAIAERKLYLLSLLHQRAQGDGERTIVTEKLADDPANPGQLKVVERSTRVEQREPSEKAIMFLLERGYREDWGPHTVVTGPDGGPVKIEDTTPIDKLMAMLAAKAEQLQGVERMIAEAADRIAAPTTPTNGATHA